MRNLIIKRNKSLAGCFGKVKVYIEDAENGELTIKGSPCRKLGELKNGEEKTFPVPETQVKVVVIADEATREFCSDSRIVPAGEEDARFSGKNTFDPQRGNPFKFDR